MFLASGSMGLGRRRWLPSRHNVGDRLCGLRSRLLDRHGRAGRLLRREAAVPGRRPDIQILAVRPVSDRAARSHMHHLDGPASRRACASGNGQRLASVSGRRFVVLEAGEDVVFVVHVDPVSEIPAAVLQCVDCKVGVGSTVCINQALRGDRVTEI